MLARIFLVMLINKSFTMGDLPVMEKPIDFSRSKDMKRNPAQKKPPQEKEKEKEKQEMQHERNSYHQNKRTSSNY
jgi:hypothetical protein